MKIEIEITASKEATNKYGTDDPIGKSRVVVEASSISANTIAELASVAAEDIAKQINAAQEVAKAKAESALATTAPKPTEPDPFD